MQDTYGSRPIQKHWWEWCLSRVLRPLAAFGIQNFSFHAFFMEMSLPVWGGSSSLDIFERTMQQHFGCTLKGRVGVEPGDKKSMRVLNRIVTVTDHGLEYEPDPRHVESRMRDHGLTF